MDMEFKAIYSAYSAKIFRLCMGYINNEEKAGDLTQETFIAVWQHLDRFRGDASIGTWIFKIAVNKCLQQLKQDKRHKEKLANYPAVVLSEETGLELEAKEKIKLLYDSIAQLPEADRLLIGLYLEDLAQDKISEIMGISHSNVRVKIHRIKAFLTEQVKKNGKY
jgi:RNA polymerase sigma-70 factor (ECF subfamily)